MIEKNILELHKILNNSGTTIPGEEYTIESDAYLSKGNTANVKKVALDDIEYTFNTDFAVDTGTIEFSTDGLYLFKINTRDTALYIYKLEGTEYKLKNTIAASTYIQKMKYSNGYLCLGLEYTPFFKAYKLDTENNTLTGLTSPTLATNPNAIDGDLNGVYWAAGHSASGYLQIIKRTDDTFALISAPAILPTGPVQSVSFTQDGSRLITGHTTSPYLTCYITGTDTLSKIANAGAQPTTNLKEVLAFKSNTGVWRDTNDVLSYFYMTGAVYDYGRRPKLKTKIGNLAVYDKYLFVKYFNTHADIWFIDIFSMDGSDGVNGPFNLKNYSNRYNASVFKICNDKIYLNHTIISKNCFNFKIDNYLTYGGGIYDETVGVGIMKEDAVPGELRKISVLSKTGGF